MDQGDLTMTDGREFEQAGFGAVLRQMPSGVIIAEAPSGRHILANERVAQRFRRPYLAANDFTEYSR